MRHRRPMYPLSSTRNGRRACLLHPPRSHDSEEFAARRPTRLRMTGGENRATTAAASCMTSTGVARHAITPAMSASTRAPSTGCTAVALGEQQHSREPPTDWRRAVLSRCTNANGPRVSSPRRSWPWPFKHGRGIVVLSAICHMLLRGCRRHRHTERLTARIALVWPGAAASIAASPGCWMVARQRPPRSRQGASMLGIRHGGTRRKENVYHV